MNPFKKIRAKKLYKKAVLCLNQGQYNDYFTKIEQAANLGYPLAQHFLSCCYQEGIGVNVDLEKFFYWAKIASENGVALAQTNLGSCYQYGWGTPVNKEKALRWTQIAANNGDPMGMHNIATFYRDGALLEKNNSKAKDYYKKAAEKGLGRAMNDLGVLYQEEQNFDDAAYWYEKAVEKEEPNSYKNLGRLYALGKGVRKDEMKVVNLFKKEPNFDDECKAYIQHVGIYQFQKGIQLIEQDKNEEGWTNIDNAIKCDIPGAYLYRIQNGCNNNGELLKRCWYLGGDMSWKELELLRIYYMVDSSIESAKNLWECDDPEYLKERGILYLTGSNLHYGPHVEQDYKMAMQLLLQASIADCKGADYWIGFCYEFGLGIEKDINRALILYNKEMQRGHHEAAFRFSSIIINYGNDDQKRIAVDILEKITNNYNPQLDNTLGNMFGGLCQDENWMGSTAWRAQCLLGDLYYHGIVYEKSEEQAIVNWEKAAKWGSSEAYYKLGEYYARFDKELSVSYYLKALYRGYFDAYKIYRE